MLTGLHRLQARIDFAEQTSLRSVLSRRQAGGKVTVPRSAASGGPVRNTACISKRESRTLPSLAFIIVDMQNDFVHVDGGFARRARAHPEAKIDLPFLMCIIPNVERLIIRSFVRTAC